MKNLAVAVVFVFSLLGNTYGQYGPPAVGDFFFSFQQNGPNNNQVQGFNPGDTGTLWIYWSTNGPADSNLDVGAFIDVISSTSGVIEFTAAETFDYDLLLSSTGKPTGLSRLAGGFGFGPSDSVLPDFIDELSSFGIAVEGIVEANNGSGVFLDAGYSPINDGFEWGRIDFNVIGEGTTTVTGVAGDGLIVNCNSIVDAVFTTVTINSVVNLIGDINCDGAVDLLDVSPFVDALSSGEFVAKADVNQDGAVNLLDVSPFIELLSGP